ncbi:glycosyltransferase family 4 protein [Dinoroseobacter sp. PD6]|uniref:glycosyltransferase family 4 protein n=1 Tax=Dinoroseobacter sp. PD6 TaxID=3028384 RepID=UPI00237C26F5|nr:glycosyltransferase family 4 protein [Dinoroseobacter sp. PD6]MDD9715168.1 glycosyltransferase family 4 protein [Dinoroseobacter sp. PD6]
MIHIRPPKQGKIGYICKRYPRFSETFIVHEILAHERAGQQVEIFALRPVMDTHFQDILSKVRAPVHRIPEKTRSVSVFRDLLEKAEALYPGAPQRALATGAATDAIAQGLALAIDAKRLGVTHFHAHFGTVATTVARVASQVSGIPYTFTAHAKDIYYRYDPPIELDVKLRDAAAAVTVSDFNLAYMTETFGKDAGGLVRLYNGLDLSGFAWSEPTARQTDILAVGRLIEKKGFHILVEALWQLARKGQTPRCRIIGMGEDEDNLRSQIAAAGLEGQVTIEGPRPQSEVIAAMRDAAVLVCPCIVARDGNRDGLPTVLLEAMALGTPCIGTDVVGLPEILRPGDTGLLASEGDPDTLSAAISQMLGDIDLRRRVSRNARRLIEEEFDIDRNAARLRELFASCAGPVPAGLKGAA